MKTKEKLTISKLAQLAKINQQTIRYYESIGLLTEPERSDSGYRQYDHSYLQQIQFIKNAQSLGFSLEQIKELVQLASSKKALGQDVKQVVKNKISELDSKITELLELKNYLEKLDKSCSGEMKTSCCPIVKSIKDQALQSCT